ncbi:MAG: branched-chain amino acid ABC transporter permease [Actinobacteria bacterium]|nr:MAG: branched-chain amino acid ABC transporter permease [Actinomycetota bacterium]
MGFIRDVLVNVTLATPLVGAYAMFALGIVFIHRASKVLNLAHGAMAMFPAFIAYSLTPHVGVFVGVLVALASGGALGLGIERFVVRRLRASSPTAQTVGTVAVLGLLIALAARIWGTTPLKAPSLFPEHSFRVGNASLSLAGLGLFFAAIAVALVFMAVFRFTDLGLAMRSAADNRRAASLMGIDPDRTTALAWFFAAAIGLHPYNLSLEVLPGFVAALIGGLESERGALIGAAIVGLTIGIVPSISSLAHTTGAPQVALAVVAFVVMARRGQRIVATDVHAGGL